MPNGLDRDWTRACAAINGFRIKYGRWPTRLLMPDGGLRVFGELLFTPESFAKLQERIEMVEADRPFVATDDDGNEYGYGGEGFPEERPDIDAEAWLGIRPDRPCSPTSPSEDAVS